MYHSRLCYPPGYAAIALAFNDMLLAIAAVPQIIYSCVTVLAVVRRRLS